MTRYIAKYTRNLFGYFHEHWMGLRCKVQHVKARHKSGRSSILESRNDRHESNMV